MFYEYDEAAQRVTINDWQVALTIDGLDSSYFGKRHHDCPICNSKNGFRIGTLKAGCSDILWVCKSCTNSLYAKPEKFLALKHQLFDGTALYRHIYQNILGNETGIKRTYAQPIRTQAPSIDRAKAIEVNEFLWTKSRPVKDGDPVSLYLRNRVPGLTYIPEEIHYTRSQYWERGDDDRPFMVGEFDAMIVRGYEPSGKFVQLHTTYLTPDGQKAPLRDIKKTRYGVDSNNFAFRMGKPENGVLGVAEGIETALSASLLEGMPVWPCHAAGIMANFDVPADMEVRCLHIFADNDRSKVQGGVRNTGLLAAEKLAKRMRSKGVKAIIHMPRRISDFNDLHNQY